MHRRMLLCFLLLVLAAAACQGPPPTQIILVVTATPEQTAEIAAVATDATVEVVPSDMPTAVSTTATLQPTATTDPFPTPTITQIQAAEQVFENGRLFWLQPTGQIWVMIVEEEGRGEWQIYEDTFVDGEPEFDPDLAPPEGFEQPRRGFGKLWRENPAIREALGWAVTPEFGFVTRYEYHPGKTPQDPGYHVLLSLYEEAFRFNEVDQTWQLN